MTNKQAMAATYTPVTLDEIETLLKRAFRTCRPQLRVDLGEKYFFLTLHKDDGTPSQGAGLRVWTSISARGDTSAEAGADAIRVQLYNIRRNKAYKPGKAPIVKRTQGWRDSLTARIEEAMDDYDDHEEEIEAGKFVQW